MGVGWFSKAPTARYKGIVNSVWLESDVKVTFIVAGLPWVMLKLKLLVEGGYCDNATSNWTIGLLSVVFGRSDGMGKIRGLKVSFGGCGSGNRRQERP